MKIFIATLILISLAVNGSPVKSKQDHDFVDIYQEIGYQSIEVELDEFQKHFNKRVRLPVRLPGVAFTHHMARFNDLEGNINDSLEIMYVSDQSPENHFKIDVRPLEYKIPIREDHIRKNVTLNNGQAACFLNIFRFNVLVFEFEGWQYMLSIDSRVKDDRPDETLVRIADSIN